MNLHDHINNVNVSHKQKFRAKKKKQYDKQMELNDAIYSNKQQKKEQESTQ